MKEAKKSDEVKEDDQKSDPALHLAEGHELLDKIAAHGAAEGEGVNGQEDNKGEPADGGSDYLVSQWYQPAWLVIHANRTLPAVRKTLSGSHASSLLVDAEQPGLPLRVDC